jgi:hypothetical protein
MPRPASLLGPEAAGTDTATLRVDAELRRRAEEEAASQAEALADLEQLRSMEAMQEERMRTALQARKNYGDVTQDPMWGTYRGLLEHRGGGHPMGAAESAYLHGSADFTTPSLRGQFPMQDLPGGIGAEQELVHFLSTQPEGRALMEKFAKFRGASYDRVHAVAGQQGLSGQRDQDSFIKWLTAQAEKYPGKKKK